MVTSKDTLEKIKKIIENRYRALTISLLGKAVFSQDELREMRKAGIDTSNSKSLMEMVYYHAFLNKPGDKEAPKTIEEMQSQQSVPGVKPEGEAHDYSVEHVNEQVKVYIDKQIASVKARIEDLIRTNNANYKLNALQNLNRAEEADELVKQSTLSKLKQVLKDTSKDGNRDWGRVAATEISEIVGLGSVDRIVSDNKEKPLEDVYVYRIVVGDERTCKWCLRFYQDSDGSPKVYKLSTLLANGSNFGKLKDAWKPVVGATHPNTRTSHVLELKPGWKVMPGGSVKFIGREAWNEYLSNKLTQ